jgi:hypothetical protein
MGPRGRQYLEQTASGEQLNSDAGAGKYLRHSDDAELASPAAPDETERGVHKARKPSDALFFGRDLNAVID